MEFCYDSPYKLIHMLRSFYCSLYFCNLMTTPQNRFVVFKTFFYELSHLTLVLGLLGLQIRDCNSNWYWQERDFYFCTKIKKKNNMKHKAETLVKHHEGLESCLNFHLCLISLHMTHFSLSFLNCFLFPDPYVDFEGYV